MCINVDFLGRNAISHAKSFAEFVCGFGVGFGSFPVDDGESETGRPPAGGRGPRCGGSPGAGASGRHDSAGATAGGGALAFQPDGRFLLSGAFPLPTSTRLVRSLPLGPVEPGYSLTPVTAITVLDDGRALVSANQLPGSSTWGPGIARLFADGSVDPDFSFASNVVPVAILPLPEGGFYVAGNFTTAGGLTRPRVARIDVNGVVDPAFAPTLPMDSVHSIALEENGDLICGGTRNTLPLDLPRFVRIRPDGSLDPAMSKSLNGSVHCVAVQRDGAPFRNRSGAPAGVAGCGWHSPAGRRFDR
jgi:hypothetical protein